MLPMEIVDRVFNIRIDDAGGTAFSLDVDDRQYLVTAKHVAEAVNGRRKIEIMYDGQWRGVAVDLVGHSDVDITVLAPLTQLTAKEMKIDTATGGFFAGHEVHFAGFPFGMMGANFDSPFPACLVKRAIISGKAGTGSKAAFYLDGHTNPGFSGAPVYFRPTNTQKFVISMVIASYTAGHEPVFDRDGNPTELHVQSNSGIISAYGIENAIELIKKAPIGLAL